MLGWGILMRNLASAQMAYIQCTLRIGNLARLKIVGTVIGGSRDWKHPVEICRRRRSRKGPRLDRLGDGGTNPVHGSHAGANLPTAGNAPSRRHSMKEMALSFRSCEHRDDRKISRRCVARNTRRNVWLGGCKLHKRRR